MAAPPHVLVVGGGIGGLTLAHGLAGWGISVAVYERDQSPVSRTQGYRISIKPEGSRALRACLPAPLFELVAATSIRSASRMVFLDHRLTPAFSKPIPAPPFDPRDGFGVNRLTLREILLAGLDRPTATVHFGKTCTGYAQLADGRVRAGFADGTSATGDLLVGADGTNSAVRAQLLPDAVVDDLEYAVYGRTPIDAGTASWLPEALTDTFNRVTGPAAALAVATCRARERPTVAAARLAPQAQLTDIPDYLQWMVAPLLGRLRGADPVALHGFAVGQVAGWDPGVVRILAEAEVAATFAVVIGSARPVSGWQAPGVTLLGDAIHTMSPGRGEGANTALRDAQLLTDLLAGVGAGRATLAQAVAQYEMEMLEYAFAAVAASLSHPFGPARFGATAGRPAGKPPAGKPPAG